MRLFTWIFDINVNIALTACLSAVAMVFLLIVGHWIWRWLSRYRTGTSGLMSARQVRVFGLVIFCVLLMPIPIAIAEAVVWQKWIEPAQRSQVRADGNRLVLALESFHERADTHEERRKWPRGLMLQPK
jgi:hypothetical protein